MQYSTFKGRVRVDPSLLKVSFTDESLPVAYLIPTLSGPGVCSVALVDLLVGAHNSFIEKCREEMSKQQLTTRGKKEWVKTLFSLHPSRTAYIFVLAVTPLEFGPAQ